MVEEGVKNKVKTELGYMKEGAKVLPKVLVKKGKKWFKDQVEAAKEKARIEREVEKEAKEAELAAYKEERIKQAKLRGAAKAKKGTTGARGVMGELGKIGDSMSVSSLLGMEEVQGEPKKDKLSVGGYLLSGLGENEKKKKENQGD